MLEFRNVTISFDGPPVLDEISFTVGPHETRVLLGPAGVGKSVLLKLANGLHCPDSGQHFSCSARDHREMPRAGSVPLCACARGWYFRRARLFDSLTVRDNVAYQLIQEEVADDEIDLRVREALRFVGLEADIQLYSPGASRGECGAGWRLRGR